MGFVAGDIELKSILLKSADGCREYDLSAQAKMINLYESILSPTIYAEINIFDGIGLFPKVP